MFCWDGNFPHCNIWSVSEPLHSLHSNLGHLKHFLKWVVNFFEYFITGRILLNYIYTVVKRLSKKGAKVLFLFVYIRSIWWFTSNCLRWAFAKWWTIIVGQLICSQYTNQSSLELHGCLFDCVPKSGFLTSFGHTTCFQVAQRDCHSA